MTASRGTVLVTGANGFVGRAVCSVLVRRGYLVRGVVRRPEPGAAPSGIELTVAPRLLDGEFPPAMLAGVHGVVHAAARVHVMHDTSTDPLAEFRRVNVEGTLRLARAAAEAGVQRFVFISSIKALGESTTGRAPFRADEDPAPVDPYGVSKQEAEVALRGLAAESGMEVVIVRPVLVYGPGVKGNFRSMLGWLERGIPLPLGAVDNRRSLVGIDNLADLIATTLEHPGAANGTFLVSDGEDLSTSDLLRRAARAAGWRARLIPVPAHLLRVAAAAVGRRAAADRLLGSLQVDISPTRERLGWTPPVPVDEGLRRAARGGTPR